MTTAERARAELVALASGRRSWSTALGRAENGAGAHRASAVLLVFSPSARRAGLRSAADAVDVLLIRRADDLRHHPGQVAFPGGGIDAGESAPDAALREAVEETGLDPGGVEVLGPLGEVPLPVSGNVVTPVVAWEELPSPLTPDGTECVAAFRCAVADLLDPARRGVVRIERNLPGVRHFTTPAFAVDGVLVWGFTAFVLDAVFDALGWTREWDREHALPLP